MNWGIIGTGNIANKFAKGLSFAKGAHIYAVASRNQNKALEFAERYSIPIAYGSYDDLVADIHIDIIYIATPNHLHHSNTLTCLNAGKPVLCEKPFALNSSQVQEMIELARRKNIFLMEALWTRFLPTISKVQQLISEGVIGEVKILKADFGFKALYNKDSRLFSPQMGGGSLLDIGIYPIFLSLLLFGKPVEIKSLQILAPTRTDMSTGMVFAHQNGEMSILTSSFAVNLETQAEIVGTEGTIVLHRMFHMPTFISINKNGQSKKMPLKIKGNGYNYQAEHVMQCMEKGLIESPILPLSFSLDLMNIIDEIQKH